MPLIGAAPKIDQYRKCVNPFWRKTAEQGAGTTAFVKIEPEYGVINYLSCLKLLKQNQVDVFIQISLGSGKKIEMAKMMAEEYHGTYSALIAGFYIIDPPNDAGAEIVESVMKKIRNLDDTYKGKLDLR